MQPPVPELAAPMQVAADACQLIRSSCGTLSKVARQLQKGDLNFCIARGCVRSLQDVLVTLMRHVSLLLKDVVLRLDFWNDLHDSQWRIRVRRRGSAILLHYYFDDAHLNAASAVSLGLTQRCSWGNPRSRWRLVPGISACKQQTMSVAASEQCGTRAGGQAAAQPVGGAGGLERSDWRAQGRGSGPHRAWHGHCGPAAPHHREHRGGVGGAERAAAARRRRAGGAAADPRAQQLALFAGARARAPQRRARRHPGAPPPRVPTTRTRTTSSRGRPSRSLVRECAGGARRQRAAVPEHHDKPRVQDRALPVPAAAQRRHLQGALRALQKVRRRRLHVRQRRDLRG